MEYLFNQLFLESGDVVEITLDTQANVILLDAVNYSKYQHQDSFRYFGGWQRKSPIHLKATHSGLWYVVIDLAGNSGFIRHSIRVIKHNFALV